MIYVLLTIIVVSGIAYYVIRKMSESIETPWFIETDAQAEQAERENYNANAKACAMSSSLIKNDARYTDYDGHLIVAENGQDLGYIGNEATGK